MSIHQIEKALQQIREVKPIVLNLTNYVTMDFVANCLLALGASPIMSVCREETEELIHVAHSLHINMGTLDNHWVEHAKEACQLAKKHLKPIMLDPVGSGASALRTNTFRELLPYVSIIRGNASEILSYTPSHKLTRGIDSVHSTIEAKPAAIQLARQYEFTVVMSGAIDYITNGKKEMNVPYGSSLMPLVTGMGCALTAIIAAFRSVIDDSLEASILGTSFFGLSGMLAETKTQYPGSFRMHFIDMLHQADFKELRALS
jgi:hydroxyethylthiazole kinase